MKKTNCIEPSVEDSIINVGDYLVAKLHETKQEVENVACKETCNINVVIVNNGSQEEVAFIPLSNTGNWVFSTVFDLSIPKYRHSISHEALQVSNEEATKVPSKVCTWGRKAKENTAGSIHGIERKRKFEDVGWMLSDNQEAQTKKSKDSGEVSTQLAMAVADLQPRPPQWVSYVGTVEGLGTIE
jgi:hypothetical protein